MMKLVPMPGLQRLRGAAVKRCMQTGGSLGYSTGVPEGADRTSAGTTTVSSNFDESQLDSLVCPLSKGKLRWDAANSELVSDEVGIAYPVVNGVPHLKPESGRVIDKPQPGSKEDEIPMQPS